MYDIIFIGKKNNSYKQLKRRCLTLKHAPTFEEAQRKSITKFFWVVWDCLDVNDDFDFDFIPSEYDEEYTHVFLNDGEYDGGIALVRKDSNPARKELDNKIFIKKIKKVEIEASKNTPYDIVFISYNEPNADVNFRALQQRFPRAKRVHGVKGIHQAHRAAAQLCDTEMFWVVDGDAQIVDDFNFDYRVSSWDRQVVHVWRSCNPVNDLEYGYGGVKLLPTALTVALDVNSVDMTTSISNKLKVMEQRSNYSMFNTDAFSTWRSAFRECVKLSSKSIRGQVDNETEERLNIWCSVGIDREFGRYSIDGARSGRKYGNDNCNNSDSLNLINDFDWLYEQFSKHTI